MNARNHESLNQRPGPFISVFGWFLTQRIRWTWPEITEKIQSVSCFFFFLITIVTSGTLKG